MTLWKKRSEFQTGFTLLSVTIQTGRTHQIRVHLSHAGHPVAGDAVYGYGRRWWKRHELFKKGILPPIKRQMLHALRLGFLHPGSQQYLEFESPFPEDMGNVLEILRQFDVKSA